MLRTTAGALLWAGAMAASAWIGIRSRGFGNGDQAISIVVLFAVGGLIAFGVGLCLAGRLAPAGGRERRMAAGFVGLSVATLAITATLFAVTYLVLDTGWREEGTVENLAYRFVFTVLAALYQFAVFGTRLYLPVSLPALFVAAAWFGRRR